HHPGRADSARRVLRIRRGVLGGGGGGVLRDGEGPHRRPSPGGNRGPHPSGRLLPDAPRRAGAPRGAAAPGPARGGDPGRSRGMSAHADRAVPFVANAARMHWHDKAVWFVRGNRDRAAASVPEWETLRELAAQVKAHTLSRLAEYLELFEQNA